MTTSVVVRFWPNHSARAWLPFCGVTLALLFALLWGARPLHAQTVYHVDDDADDGLVAHWQFDSQAAVTLDYQNLIPATLTNNTSLPTSFTNVVPTLLRANPSSLTLDGSNDRMTVADDARLNRTGNFTVAAWVRRDSINTYEPIYDSGFNANAWWFFISGDNSGTVTDNRLGFGVRGIAPEYYANTIIPADGQWRHVAVVFDTTTNPNMRFYLNGVLDASVNVTQIIATPSGVKQIGGITDGGTLAAAFDGSLDEVRFYERVLSQTEIDRLADGRTCVTEGISWETAFPNIQCALELSNLNTTRVAKGRYIPGVHPAATFFLDDGDKLIGGFNGNEAANVDRPAVPLDQSNPVNYLDSAQYSVLTGDVLGNDPPDAMTDLISPADEEADNVDRVVDIGFGISGTNLDGFVVTGGRNDEGNGGGVRVNGSAFVQNNIFYLNRANNGGGFYLGGGGLPSLLALRFVKNEALTNGGGLYADGSTVMSNARFINNSAAGNGGGFASTISAGGCLANVTFTGNQANGGVGGGVNFCCTSGILKVSNVLVEGNESAGNGGGMNVCCAGSISGQHLTLTGNQSAANGGGLSISSGITSTLQGVTITANIAMTDGGGVHLSGGGVLSITNGLLANNSGAWGGAVYGETGGDFILANGSLEENSAQRGGGGIYVNLADIFLTNVEVARNTTNSSGGAGLYLTDSDSVLKDVQLIENSAGDDDGGGIRVRDGTLSLDRVSFLGNAANRNGGALSVESDAHVTASNLLLVGNVGNTEGDADDVANAIYIEVVSTLHLINSSLAANSGAGASLFNLQGSAKITFTNVILWDNAPAGNIIEGTASVVEQNVIVGNPISGVNPRFTLNPFPGDGNWATPADNNYGDLRLLSSSPALDQGNGALLPAGITQDFGGNPRIFDLGYVANAFASPVDLGAYEARFVAPIANPGAAYAGNEGAAIALNASASTDDGNIISFAWDCNSDNLIDAITASPTGSFCTYGDNGTFTLLLGVTDNDFVGHAVSVPVTVNNVAPNAQDDGATTAEDTAVTINALTNDSDVPADPLTISAVGTPTNGSAAIVQGQIVYTPTADFNGSDSFTYTISDGDGGSDSATVTVTVTPVDDPDVPVDDPDVPVDDPDLPVDDPDLPVEKPTIHLPMLSKH